METIVELKINSLGPVVNSKIEIKPFLIFYGEPSTGKSYTSFAVYRLLQLITNKKEIEKAIRNSSMNYLITNLTEENKKQLNYDFFPKEKGYDFNINLKEFLDVIKKYYKESFNEFFAEFINYTFSDTDVELDIKGINENQNYKIILLNSGSYSFLLDNENNLIPSSSVGVYNISIQTNFSGPTEKINVNHEVIEMFMDRLSGILWIVLFNKYLSKDYIPEKNLYLLPPSRNTLLNIINMVFLGNLERMPLLGIYKEFYTGILKTGIGYYSPIAFESPDFKTIAGLFGKLLGGQFIVKKDGLHLRTIQEKNDNYKDIPYSNLATSFQELSPLYYILTTSVFKDLAISYEEPEAHLHPKVQRILALILSIFVNQGGFLQITTHSDYLTNRFNNLIKLNELRKKDKDLFKEALTKLDIPESSVLNTDLLGAYYFSKSENFQSNITPLEIEDYGIPMKSFENELIGMSQETDYLMNLLEKLD